MSAKAKLVAPERRASVTPAELMENIKGNISAVYKALSSDPLKDYLMQVYLDALSIYHAQQAGERVIAQQVSSLEDIAAQRDATVDYMTTQRAAIRSQGWHDGRAALAKGVAAQSGGDPLLLMQALEAICNGSVPAGGEDAAALGIEALYTLAELLRKPSELPAEPVNIEDEGFGI
jgi:hypothetical protein